MTIPSYPLAWPQTQPRTDAGRRVHARFKVEIADTLDDLMRELDLLHTRDVVVSSMVALKRNGLPYANSPEPLDPGVAVYFDRRAGDTWKPFVIACDHYTKFRWNLRAIAMTVEALRTIARHGASSMLEQAFTGFAALPPATNGAKPWWEVLGVKPTDSPEVIRQAWLELVHIHHPDTGGDTKRMAEINAAYEAARENK
jgi:hypothetical protein